MGFSAGFGGDNIVFNGFYLILPYAAAFIIINIFLFYKRKLLIIELNKYILSNNKTEKNNLLPFSISIPPSLIDKCSNALIKSVLRSIARHDLLHFRIGMSIISIYLLIVAFVLSIDFILRYAQYYLVITNTVIGGLYLIESIYYYCNIKKKSKKIAGLKIASK